MRVIHGYSLSQVIYLWILRLYLHISICDIARPSSIGFSFYEFLANIHYL